MTDLTSIFAELGISHYLNDFIEQGFDTWETILDITESDFDALGVKLGHRRKLQRKIANSRGISADRALASPRNTPTDDRHLDEQKASGAKTEGKDGAVPGTKRKYRRHPKPDENAPERPPSAYVIFSNKMREDLKGRNLSFTEIAKLVGENWQNLSPAEKDPYEQQAFTAKDRYNNELAEYKKTDQFAEYSQYLVEFKARHSNPQQVNEPDLNKRPKLEAHASGGSGGSGGTVSSTASQMGNETPTGHMRIDLPLSAPRSGQWHTTDGHSPPQRTTLPQLAVAVGSQNLPGSLTSPTILPGYRDSIYAPLPWREGQRDDNSSHYQQLPQLGSAKDRQRRLSGGPNSESKNLTGSPQHTRRTGLAHPPPLLTSESTNRSTASSGSTVSSAYFSPRTPMEPPLERALPIPSLFNQKPTGGFDNQLPPIRRPSPQTTAHGTQNPPSTTHNSGDFPSSIPPIRGYGHTGSHTAMSFNTSDYRGRDYTSSSGDEPILDPVSALLRAGEIVNQNSRGRSNS